jgi:hypothetical protein
MLQNDGGRSLRHDVATCGSCWWVRMMDNFQRTTYPSGIPLVTLVGGVTEVQVRRGVGVGWSGCRCYNLNTGDRNTTPDNRVHSAAWHRARRGDRSGGSVGKDVHQPQIKHVRQPELVKKEARTHLVFQKTLPVSLQRLLRAMQTGWDPSFCARL